MTETSEHLEGVQDDVINLTDYIEDEDRREEEANAVLGGGDASNCSYSKGYMKRQPVFSCASCYDKEKGYAGICLGCSIECHNGHDVYELYTKRHMRCDCGNSKMSLECKLDDTKSSLNTENVYSHNFDGLYCRCQRPYPDPERTDGGGGEEMITCCICEDWFHDNHLDATIPDNYDEMACNACVKQYPFLCDYTIRQSFINVSESSTNAEPASIESETRSAEDNASSSIISESGTGSLHTNGEPIAKKPKTMSGPGMTDDGKDAKPSTDIRSGDCCRPKSLHTPEPRTLFFTEGWRSRLCQCEACLTLMKDIEFLCNPEDTIAHYESLHESGSNSLLHERGLQALSSLDRGQQIEMISGFTDMKTELSDYLRSFAESGKVVKEEDIREFFEEYKKNKRARVAMPPSRCN